MGPVYRAIKHGENASPGIAELPQGEGRDVFSVVGPDLSGDGIHPNRLINRAHNSELA